MSMLYLLLSGLEKLLEIYIKKLSTICPKIQMRDAINSLQVEAAEVALDEGKSVLDDLVLPITQSDLEEIFEVYRLN